MVLRKTLAGLAVASTLLAGAAQAATIHIDGGTFGSIPGNPTGAPPNTGHSPKNDALAPLFGAGTTTLNGYGNSTIKLTRNSIVTFTYFGSEASFANTFVSGGNSTLTNNLHSSNNFFNPAGIASFVTNLMAGVAAFQFNSNGGPGPDFSVVNGDNTNEFKSFFASVVGNQNGNKGNSVWLFFDDGGAGPDDNHDDLVIRMDAVPAPVPLPAAGGLLVLGMGALAAIKRRRAAA